MNSFVNFVTQHKTDIRTHLEQRMAEFHQRYASYGRWTADALRRIADYTARGKMLRGALVMLAGQGYGNGEVSSAILDVAVAMELLQSFLLIHDDVMDRDLVRRGAASMHVQYATGGESIADEGERIHYGNAMAICCGDIAFALVGLQIDSALHNSPLLPATTRSKIAALYNSEVIRVGGAQMDDITFSSIATEEPSPVDVLELYRNKTGYYSIVLPLTLGALLANQQQELPLIEQIGCYLGEVFQIRDDLLGLDEDVHASNGGISKSMASDIANKKRTYARQLLLHKGDADDRRELDRLESDEVGEEERVKCYRALLERTGVKTHIEERVSTTTTDALALIDKLQACRSAEREILRQFCSYNSQRRA